MRSYQRLGGRNGEMAKKVVVMDAQSIINVVNANELYT
jgi:hypothetical protein